MNQSMTDATTPILQFGTSRFLLAHADLFISEALDKDEALGRITIVQTTDNVDSSARLQALAEGGSYPVRIRGLVNGQPVDEERQGRAIARALYARTQWPEIRAAAIAAEVILSNTGDRGFELDPADDETLVDNPGRAPSSFPAKITMLLLARYNERPDAPVSLFPCELIQRNGDKLRTIVMALATEWRLPSGFMAYLDQRCHFANSLVDRIVSEPIKPVGAIAETYALWAIEAQAGLVLPCRHPSIVVTDDLDRFERLKLHLLNLGHTYLAERWIRGERPAQETVRQIMEDAEIRGDLESVWHDEVLPVLSADGLNADAVAYIADVRDRFLNPFLAHRLSDIAGNHAEKKSRRLQPIVARATELGLTIEQPHLHAAMKA